MLSHFVLAFKVKRRAICPPSRNLGADLLLGGSLNARRKARLVPGAGILMNDALFDALVDERNRLAVKSLSLGLIAGGDSGLELTELGAQAGLVGAVNRGLRFRLP